VRHDPGLAASPPTRYTLKWEDVRFPSSSTVDGNSPAEPTRPASLFGGWIRSLGHVSRRRPDPVPIGVSS